MFRKIAVAVLVVFGSASVYAEEAQWEFKVFLDDKPIGYHNFSLTQEGSEQILQTEARFDVKFLFVTAFRYRHANTEIWRHGCLEKLDAQTNSNGRELEVEGEAFEDGFAVTTTAGSETLGRCVQSFAYWNPQILSADKLLNTQTGEFESVAVAAGDDVNINVGDGVIAATSYTLTAKGGDISLWYAKDDGRWLSLEAPAKGGRRIRYEPLTVPAPSVFDELIARTD